MPNDASVFLTTVISVLTLGGSDCSAQPRSGSSAAC
jgi:hypothetical protein